MKKIELKLNLTSLFLLYALQSDAGTMCVRERGACVDSQKKGIFLKFTTRKTDLATSSNLLLPLFFRDPWDYFWVHHYEKSATLDSFFYKCLHAN